MQDASGVCPMVNNAQNAYAGKLAAHFFRIIDRMTDC